MPFPTRTACSGESIPTRSRPDATSAQRLGIDPDLIVGTAGGALNVAYITRRPGTVPATDELGRAWSAPRRLEIFASNGRAAISAPTDRACPHRQRPAPSRAPLSADRAPRRFRPSLAHTSQLCHQEVSHGGTRRNPQTNRLRVGRLLDRRSGGRSLPRSWLEVARAALPGQRHERLVGPGCCHNGGSTAKQVHGLVRLGRETVRACSRPGFAGAPASHRRRVPRRLAVALLVLGCMSLLTPHQSLASSLLAREESHAGSPQSRQTRPAQGPRHTAGGASSRADVRSTSDDTSVLILVVLTLNSALMLIRVASSPPGWIKD
jgi:hypothetical protein